MFYSRELDGGIEYVETEHGSVKRSVVLDLSGKRDHASNNRLAGMTEKQLHDLAVLTPIGGGAAAMLEYVLDRA